MYSYIYIMYGERDYKFKTYTSPHFEFYSMFQAMVEQIICSRRELILEGWSGIFLNRF